MLRSVLIGLDGSDYSSAATELALAWAKQREMLLVGLGIIPRTGESEATPLGFDVFKEKADTQHRHQVTIQVEQILERFSLRCAQESIPSKILEEVGSPLEQITEEARRYDLIFLGQQTFFNSLSPDEPDATLTDVIKNTPRPVVSVPLGEPKFGPVLVAYDGSLQASRTLLAFASLGLAGYSGIRVVTVLPKFKDAARHADRAQEFLRLHTEQVTAMPIASSHGPDEVLLAKADELKAGLIVMGSYGKKSFREFFFGSTTKKVLRHSKVPVFLFN